MALEAGILSIIVALVRRGRIMRLAELKIERLWLVFVPAGIIILSMLSKRFVPMDVWTPLTGWLHLLTLPALLAFFWANRMLPGMKWLLAGWFLNLLPIAANAGKMPVSIWAAKVSGAAEARVAVLVDGGTANVGMMRHVSMSSETHFNFLADFIPMPRPPAIEPGAVSPGDVLMAVGVFLLIQLTMRPRKTGGEG